MSKPNTGRQEQAYPVAPEITEELPLVPFKVMAADLPFYSDPDCKNRVEGAHICVLRALDPDDSIQEADVVPTKGSYKVGQYLDWTLDSKTLWETCWYKNPETGQVEKAWTFHVLFTGRVIDPAVLKKSSRHLEDREKRTFERIRKREAQRQPVN